MVAYRRWWLTRVAHTWRYLACEEQPGELAQSLGGFLQLLYYLSHVSYKLQKSLVLCFSKIAELLKIAHEKRKHFSKTKYKTYEKEFFCPLFIG